MTQIALKYAQPHQRIFAFWLDLLAMISFIAVAGRIFWEIVPGSEVRASAMQLFTDKDFNNFKVTVLFSFVVLTLYNFLAPLSRLRGTLGQFLFKIQLGEVTGAPMGIKTSALRLCSIFVKYFLIVALGPWVASQGENFAASLIAVLLPLATIILTSVVAWLHPQGAGPVEKICEFRYFSR